MEPIISEIAIPRIGEVFSLFDVVATLFWAISGAMLGARRGFDILGIFIVAMVSSVGGGLLRDGFFLQDGPPRFLQSPLTLGLIVAAVLIVLLIGHRIRTLPWFGGAVAALDAMGAGAYSVVGIQLAIAASLPVGAVILIGMVNAIGGGMLRDILLGQVPQVLKPGVVLSLATLSGCILFVALLQLEVASNLAGLVTVIVVFAIRMVALRFDLRTRALSRFEEDWRAHHPRPSTPANRDEL
jgi:uncharacterized membrane protein YeiH